MAQTPFSYFYWSDWLGDPELRACSALSRSIWMDMLCLGGLSVDRRGFVMIANRPASPADLARISGEPLEVVEGCLNELERNEVFSRDREGRIYSRRMVRETKRMAASAKGGKKGGEVTRSRRRGIFSTQGTTHDSNTKYQIPNTIPLPPKGVDSPGQKEGKVKEDAGRVNRISKALRLDPGDFHRYARVIEQMVDYEQKGIDIDRDLIPCIEQMVADGRIPEDVRSLAYFEKPVRSFVQARAIAAEVERAQGAEQAEKAASLTTGEWNAKLWKWLFSGFWHPDFGPRPDHEGCLVPPKLLAGALNLHKRIGGVSYVRHVLYGNTSQYVPPGWPESKPWPLREFQPDDLREFLTTGEDFRTKAQPPADNVIPLRQVV